MNPLRLPSSREPFVNTCYIKPKSRTTGAEKKGQKVTQLLCQEKYLHKAEFKGILKCQKEPAKGKEEKRKIRVS